MKTMKVLLTPLVLVMLAGCYKTELGGAVPGSRVIITELRSGDTAQAGLRSRDFDDFLAEESQGEWDELNDLFRQAELGNFFPDSSRFERPTFYLVSANGGEDMDADSDGREDRRYTEVAGRWRAIMRGSELRNGRYVVSVVTEAIYQLVKDDIESLTDNQLQARLDDLTADFLDDVNRDGTVDYLDALTWSVLFHKGNYQGDPADLLAMAGAVTEGAGPGTLAEIAARLARQAPDALAYYRANISSQIVQRRCINCHITGGSADARGARLIFVNSGASNFMERNHQAFIDFATVLGSRDLSDYVSGKANGQGHGGGTQLATGSQDLANLRTYLNLLE